MVNESDMRANAKYLAEHMAGYGWKYVTVDYYWYFACGSSKRPVLVKSFLPRGVSVLIRDSLLRPDVTPQQRLGP